MQRANGAGEISFSGESLQTPWRRRASLLVEYPPPRRRAEFFGGVGILLVMPSYIHVVVLRLKDDATAEQKASIVEGLRALPAQIPQIQTYRAGLDLGLDPSGCHVGIVGTFESPQDYDVYAKHEAHVGLITTQIKPVIAKRAAVQFTRVRLADPPRQHPGGTTPPALTHCVLLKLKEDATPEQREDILQGLATLPPMISQIQAYRIGPDAGQDPAKFDIAIVGDFNSVEDYKAYGGDAAHIDVITSKIKPFLEERVAVQFSASDSPSDGPAAKRSKDAHEDGDEAAGGGGAGD